jgi:hypothetical protein
LTGVEGLLHVALLLHKGIDRSTVSLDRIDIDRSTVGLEPLKLEMSTSKYFYFA